LIFCHSKKLSIGRSARRFAYPRLAHGHALREDRCIASRREIRHDLEQKLAAAERLEAGAERIRDGWAFSG
jgi:hypothetical protein